MDDQGSETVMDAVRYTSGVQTESQGIDSRVDDIRIRGFDASSWSNNLYLDGLRMPRGGQWTTPQVDAYGLERVEVLKGPAAVLYGQVAPGGLVNMVAKRPTFEQTNEVVVERAISTSTKPPSMWVAIWTRTARSLVVRSVATTKGSRSMRPS